MFTFFIGFHKFNCAILIFCICIFTYDNNLIFYGKWLSLALLFSEIINIVLFYYSSYKELMALFESKFSSLLFILEPNLTKNQGRVRRIVLILGNSLRILHIYPTDKNFFDFNLKNNTYCFLYFLSFPP